MASHHFIGTGPYSEWLELSASDPDQLLATMADRVSAIGFEVVLRSCAVFPNGGRTLVWILAESHLVLHYWGAEGFATIDLHVCDYQASNAAKAAALVEVLEELCFQPRTAVWERLVLKEPRVPA